MSEATQTPENLDSLHHVAISVSSISEAVTWYTTTFRCEIAYQDDTWALLKFRRLELASLFFITSSILDVLWAYDIA